MNQDNTFTNTLQAWMNTPDSEKNWDAGALTQQGQDTVCHRLRHLETCLRD